jgi:regulator of replication initiation timing
MSENTDTPIMNEANEWNDRRDLLAQIGILERQLAEAKHQVEKYAAEARSAIQENERLFSELAEARAKVDYAESHGLHIGTMVTTDKPEGLLAHEYRQGSTLARMFDEWSDSIGLKAERDEAIDQRDRLAEALR